MTSEGFGEMFECDSADTCAGKFPLMLLVVGVYERFGDSYSRANSFILYCSKMLVFTKALFNDVFNETS